MNRSRLANFLLALLVLTLSSSAGAEAAPATRWLPPETVLALEISQPDKLLNPLLHEKTLEAAAALRSSEPADSPDLRVLLTIVKHLETQLGTDWRSIVRNAVGQGITFAAGPKGEMVLCLDAQEPLLLEQLHNIVSTLATLQSIAQNKADQLSATDYRGAKAWSFSPKEAHAIVGNRFLLANDPRVLKRALDLRADADGSTLADSPAYQAAKQAAGAGAAATLYLDLQAIRAHPKLQRVLSRDDNPLAALLLAHSKEALQNANWLAAGVYVEDEKLTLKFASDAPVPGPASAAGFATPGQSGGGALPNLNVPGRIASLSLYRDLHRFYAAKDDLFPERTSGLIFFENMMGIFFSGLNLTEEVMAETHPEVRLVVAAQNYDPAIGAPSPQIPAFAAVLRLRQPAAFGEVFEEAWQKAIGLANFTRGQKALPGMVIDRRLCGETKYTVAAFRPTARREGAEIHSRYNFNPSLARVGELLILSSTEELARDLIVTLQEGPVAATAERRAEHSFLEIDGPGLRSILAANRDAMVRKNMLDKGSTREQAEGEIGKMFFALDAFNQATISLGSQDARTQATLELSLKLPAMKRALTVR